MRTTLRVATVRSQRPGRTVFTGKAVDVLGRFVDFRSYYVVIANRSTLLDTVEPGQWWTVQGPTASRSVEAEGFQMTEHTIEAQSAQLERLSGEHLIAYISQSSVFQGVGPVKARKLWNALGDSIYSVLDEGDKATLSRYLKPDIVERLLERWAIAGNSKTLKWLFALGLDSKLAKQVLEFHGTAAPERIEEDPYRLLSFSASWPKVDALATSAFGLADADERRLLGAVEEACYHAFAQGDTAIAHEDMERRVAKLLGRSPVGLVASALALGHSNGSFVLTANGVQPLGAAAMEAVVAETVTRLVTNSATLLTSTELRRQVSAAQKAQGFTFSPEQRQAIQMANEHQFLLISGGAGVGKTALLRAVLGMFEASGIAVEQLALAGRAAKRMNESTGRPARTIASFIHQRGQRALGPLAVVIDEASMVDLPSMATLVERLPDNVRLILLGDSHQLMPVGPGLVFHCLVEISQVPHVSLTSVKRHEGELLSAAMRTRAGIWQGPPQELDAPVALLPCELDEATVAKLTVDVYMQAPDSTQILASKVEGAGGTKSINAEAQRRLTALNAPLRDSKGRDSGIRVGDPVMCVRNLWDRGLQNGSLGVVTEVFASPMKTKTSGEQPVEMSVGKVRWDDGIDRPVDDILVRELILGYAITIHKAQGSQWPRIVIAAVEGRNLDRAMLYTALTRAQLQAILIGGEPLLERVVTGPLKSSSRRVGLQEAVSSRFLGSPVTRRGCPLATSGGARR